jgi:hypothetical protein
MNKESLATMGKLGSDILIPLAFALVPTLFLESGHSLCLIKLVFGIECLGCGMTRAISSVLHGDIVSAFQHNKLVIVVFPLLCYIWLQHVIEEYHKVLVASLSELAWRLR